jgi:hypothetical protein
MAQQIINTGIAANDGKGDSLLSAGIKINANFTELYLTKVPAFFGNANKVLSTNGTSLFWVPSTVSDAIQTTNVYNDPTWIGTLAYSKLTGKPTIPTLVSQLSNDTGFITTNGLPSQSGNTGKYLTTNGTSLSWITPTSGTVTDVTVATANGFTGTVATSTTTPVITITTSITGLLKGNGTAISAATAGTDFQAAISATGLLKSNGTSGNVSAAVAGTDYFAPASTTANYVLAAPSGSAGTPTFRALVAADIPSLTSAQLATIVSDETGTGVAVFGTSPAITTSITTASTTFSLINSTATTINFAGGATTALNIGASSAPITGFAAPATTSSTSASLGYLGMPQQSKSSAYTTVIGDAGKHIYVTATATITIDSNTNVSYPIGTAIAFIAAAGATVTIAITTDLMYLGGTGTTGSRTLAAHGMATAIKVSSTTWYINGTGLT